MNTKKITGPLLLQKLENFMLELVTVLNKYPRSQKYTLAQRSEILFIQALENIYFATYLPEKRQDLLKEARVQFQILNLLLKIARRLSFLSEGSYEKLSLDLIEIGKMTTGWLKNLNNLNKNKPRTCP